MKRTLATLSLAAISFAALAQPIPDEYIVTLKAGADPKVVAAGHGIAPSHTYGKVLNGFAGKIPPGILKKLQADGQVASIVPNQRVFIVAKPGGGGTTTPAQVVPEGVKRIGASPGSLSQTGTGVGVAVVDTGLDFNHADLPVNTAYSFSAFSGTAQDDQGHGTHVGGIVAAKNNNQDVVGVAPGATLYAIKVLGADGSGSDAQVIAGLNDVAANAAGASPAIKVVNMSLGRPKSANPADDAPMETAINALVNQGITVVVAAGNDQNSQISDMVPAGFVSVISVASTTAKAGTSSRLYGGIVGDAASWFTTDGTGVTLSAPGEDQENVANSGVITSVGILSTKLGGGTTRMQGTSMASPHVAGVVALLYQQSGSLTPAAVKTKLQWGAILKGTAPYDSKTSKGYTITGYTYDGIREGILNAKNALQAP